ncbi:hypothetical protein PoB_007705300 [Plakobranchus ocellatus]|uniref:Uncharacterized protein n=1 Tax=Plakobranchus ocellatus TaxID=259542 RepID=A0AAV4E1P8_9GAST|nr:hypothetical protein PoB_007705300 [Plakobranchus ocellatus]
MDQRDDGVEAEGRGEVQMDQSREDGLVVEGRGPSGPGQGSTGRQRWERDSQGVKEVMGKGLSGGGSWEGVIKKAVRHKSPMCTVAYPYEGRYVQGASVCTATVLISDMETQHFRTG